MNCPQDSKAFLCFMFHLFIATEFHDKVNYNSFHVLPIFDMVFLIKAAMEKM